MLTEVKEVIIEETTYSDSAFGVTEEGDGVFFNARIVQRMGLKGGQTVLATITNDANCSSFLQLLKAVAFSISAVLFELLPNRSASSCKALPFLFCVISFMSLNGIF